MKKYISTLALILLSVILISAVKYDFTNKLQQALSAYRLLCPEEKTYVQTDKTYYKPSETIWYKGFLVNGTDNKPSETSDVVYIELISPWGKVIKTNEQNALEGTYSGSFTIDETAPGGLYTIRAYTHWMKNRGEEFYFTKELTVQKVITPRILLKLDFAKRAYAAGDEVVADLKVTDLKNNKTTGSEAIATVRIGGVAVKTVTSKTENGEAAITFRLPEDLNTTDGILQIVVRDKGVEESITRSIPIVLNTIELKFFPEGGNLIEGVKNNVAFEALNEFGKGADVKGEIVDRTGNKITTFESFHLGMGAFEFTPEEGETYYANIIRPQNRHMRIAIPQAEKRGFSLKLQAKNEKSITWDIYAPDHTENITFAGQTQKCLYYNETLKLKKGWNKIEVETSAFPMGIATFTLFDNGKETCERLVFLQPDKGLHIKITTNKEHYKPTEEVILNIETTDSEGKPTAASIGLAVVDEQLLTLANDKQDNILSYLLFSSELKGKIEEPFFYFNKEEPKAEKAIDYLMLTHGWRSFVWEDVWNPSAKEITFFAEKHNTTYGYVLDKKGKPVQANVYIIEMGGKRRVGKIKTTGEGYFVCHNVDPTDVAYAVTRLPNKIYLLDRKPEIAPYPTTILSPDAGADNAEGIAETDGNTQEIRSGDVDYISEDIPSYFSGSQAQLLESCVIASHTGYVSRSLTKSASATNPDDIIVVFPNEALTALLAPHLRFALGEPLVIIDDIPVSGSFPDVLEFINPDDIQYISVYKKAPLSATSDSRAANGMLILKTKNAHFNTKYIPPKRRFSYATKPRRVFYTSTPYYQSVYNYDLDQSTVYWNGDVQTDHRGRAEIKFNNSIHSSTFRITAEGISANTGLAGSETKRIVTMKPISADVKIPVFAATNDLVKLSVMVRNTTDETMSGTVSIGLSEGLSDSLLPDQDVEIPPQETRIVHFPVKVGRKTGQFTLSIKVMNQMFSDVITRDITVRDIHFPYTYSFSGNEMEQTESFTLPSYIEGTLKAEATTYFSVLDELIDGVESIFRVPSGCFEQVSSSTFPNIFALQLLRATGQVRPEIERKATTYLQSGYKKLAAYEVKGTNGFDWYGSPPAHEVLSAYGLVEFYEMAKVFDGVDEAMMKRTLDYILSRKNGNGGFRQNSGRYGFSAAPEHVNNAYIVYALTETGNTSGIDNEYRSSLQVALDNKDMYCMALMANAAYNMKDMESYDKLISLFGKENLSKIKVQSTIVYSYGDYGRREAIAFWLMALLKDQKKTDLFLIEQCVRYINSGRKDDGFGNSQTTSVCLQALAQYATRMGARSEIEGTFCTTVNDSLVSCEEIGSTMMSGACKLTVDFSSYLKKGRNTINVKFGPDKNKYPYGVNVYWQSATPPSSDLCPLRLTTTLGSNTIKVNETTRLSVKIRNIKSEGLPMSIAVIGIPGGLSLQPWQLKELQDKKIFDFYEILNDNLVIYYRELGPDETKIIDLDLKAETAGQYKGMASAAYQYYMNDFKCWVDGISVYIE